MREEPSIFPSAFPRRESATLDYLIELVGAGERTPFFFVQVKTTREGYTRRKRTLRLKIGLSRRDVHRLALFPAPTYVIGIDERQEVGYIAAILEGMTASFSSLPTDFALDERNLRLLWEEVRQFWEGRDMSMRHSLFAI